MIKRTPQEIADFFQCYVAQDDSGVWFLHAIKPNKGVKEWVEASSNIVIIFSDLVDIPKDHDWTHLYEPQKTIFPESTVINEESGRNCQKHDLCPHQSEVHTHKEYDVVGSDDLSRMKHDISALMEQGWKLQGGIAVEHLSMADGYVNDVPVFYQAMVRGV